MPSYETNILI